MCETPAQECFCPPSAFLSRDVRSPPGRGGGGGAEEGRLQYLIHPRYDPKNSAAADKAAKSIGVYLQRGSSKPCWHRIIVSVGASLKMGRGPAPCVRLITSSGVFEQQHFSLVLSKHTSSDRHSSILPSHRNNLKVSAVRL